METPPKPEKLPELPEGHVFSDFEEFLAYARQLPDIEPEDINHLISVCGHCPPNEDIYHSMDDVIDHLDNSDHYKVKEIRIDSAEIGMSLKKLSIKIDRNEVEKYQKQMCEKKKKERGQEEEEPLFPLKFNSVHIILK